MLSEELIVETAQDRRRRPPTPLRDLPSAARGRRPQPACRRGRGARRRGRSDHRARRSTRSAPRASTPSARSPPTPCSIQRRAPAYDAAICMYHDQALIPAKTLSFAETVNVTLGLAFVRTSPDHGTALDIAGTGKADPSSLAAALRLAAELVANELARMSADRRPAAAPRGHRPARALAPSRPRPEFPPRPQPDGADRAGRRRPRRRHRHRGRPGPGRTDPGAARGGGAAGRRDRARRALLRGARRDRGALSRPARRSSTATRSRPTSRRSPTARRGSSPTSPTTSRRRFSSAGCGPSPGRRSTNR